MDKIIDTRGSGKTSRLMLLAKENNGVFVCSNPHSAQAKAHAYGLTGFDIVSYSDFYTNNYNLNKPVYVDELETYVKCISMNHLSGYTLTIGD